ncbi:RNA-binding S4 domain-containing protein [Nevskia ramosa]|uniref:RNA-binding S4 domain-containing protein n=1 Tax=Nevskia ramosa TaxID=64002 RepID=UPI0003B42B42|nr:RNA-binding S4 domain-containing protein [Nevskia ramosa]
MIDDDEPFDTDDEEDGDTPAAARHPKPVASVRLDKWLWAARFYKTRSIAKEAIDAGHVRYDGQRTKVAKDVAIGAEISVRKGQDELQVTVRERSDQRLAAPFARLLYAETEASKARRAREAELRAAADDMSSDRPNKLQRRLIHKFKRSLGRG